MGEESARINGPSHMVRGESASDQEFEEEEVPQEQQIHDYTEQDLMNLKRTIYLTIMSSVDYEECAHKLLKIQIRPGQENVLAEMINKCC